MTTPVPPASWSSSAWFPSMPVVVRPSRTCGWQPLGGIHVGLESGLEASRNETLLWKGKEKGGGLKLINKWERIWGLRGRENLGQNVRRVNVAVSLRRSRANGDPIKEISCPHPEMTVSKARNQDGMPLHRNERYMVTMGL